LAADDGRVYSDEEFALILRRAAELSSQSDHADSSPDGLTLAEMKSAAAQAGLDPALVEQAARTLALRTTTSPFERLTGGPLQHQHDVHFDVTLNEKSSARLLSAVRLTPHFHSPNAGHSDALGMMWKASGDGNVLSIVAKPDADGTSVMIVIDRRGTFVLTGLLSAIAVFGALVVATGVASVAPSLAPVVALTGIGGPLVFARRFWSASSRKARERINQIVDTVGRTLGQSE